MTESWQSYWEASSLSRSGARDFSERARAFRPLDPAPEPFAQAGPEVPLPHKMDSLQRLFGRRNSRREFSDRPLSAKDLGTVFSSFSLKSGRRTYPSAGALYPVHLFALALRVEEPWGGFALRYEPRSHALAKVEAVRDLDEARDVCSVEPGISPQLIVIFVVDPDEIERKYGERAGRFILLEAGHASQNLALRLARSRMNGYELGGLQDAAVKQLLGLSETRALIAHGYACGR